MTSDLFRRYINIVAESSQQLTEDSVTAFASKAHDEWRQGWIKQNAGKSVPRVKKNSDGTEGDINVPFEKLHPDWQKENLAAGRAAAQAVKQFPNDEEKAAEMIHIEWMKRNPKADYNAAQHVPYDQLPEPEKEKDRVHVRTMKQLMGQKSSVAAQQQKPQQGQQGVAEGSGREMTGSARDKFISAMTPRMDNDALMQKVAKVVNSPEFDEDKILQIVGAGDKITHPVGRYIQKEFDELQYDLGRQYEDYPERVAEKLLSMLIASTKQGVAEGSTDDPRFQKMMGNIQQSTPNPVGGYVAVSYASERPSKKIKGVTYNGKPMPSTVDPEGFASSKIKFTPDQIEAKLAGIGQKYGWDSIDPGHGQGYDELYFDTSTKYTSATQRKLATNIVKTVNEINKFFNDINRSLQATGLPGYKVNVWQGMGENGNINQYEDLSHITNIAKGQTAKPDAGPAIGKMILKHLPSYEAEKDELGYDSQDFQDARNIANIYITQGERAGLQAQHDYDEVSDMIDELLSDAGASDLRTIWDLDEQGVAEDSVLDRYRDKVRNQGYIPSQQARLRRQERDLEWDDAFHQQRLAALQKDADARDDDKQYRRDQWEKRDQWERDNWDKTFDMMRDRINRYQWSTQRGVDPKQVEKISNIKYQPAREALDSAVNNQGLTQAQWIQKVKQKFPAAKIARSKMLNGPVHAFLPDGKKLSWNKGEKSMAEHKKSLADYVAESELAYSKPVTGDYFAINIKEDTLFETWVCDETEDGIVIYADHAGMQLLESHGYIGEELQESHDMEYEIDSDEDSVDVVDQGEYDQEGDMAKDDLATIVRAARRLTGMLDDDENMPEWVQSKINKAADYVDTAADYIESNKEREQGVAEGTNPDEDHNPIGPGWKTEHGVVIKVEGNSVIVKTAAGPMRLNYTEIKRAEAPQQGVAEDEMDEAKYQGREVPLGKPMKGDVKKSKVYVRGPKGNVVKVNFGQKGMKIKKNIPGRRKNFRARHNCDNPGPRHKARYWSCRAW